MCFRMHRLLTTSPRGTPASKRAAFALALEKTVGSPKQHWTANRKQVVDSTRTVDEVEA